MKYITEATFEHCGQKVTARKITDDLTGKFFGWFGITEENISMPQFDIAARNLVAFEKNFIALIDKYTADDEPTEKAEWNMEPEDVEGEPI